MLTKHEINALNLSPTKKDFVQIWNELLDVAGKLSERWDPTSTNESDPGIVLLKALTGIADKLNYNIDKNILEAFMPTAAQEDSMRKLCEMLGYNIKYYQSAKTEVTIKYHNSDPTEEETAAITSGLLIPKFTVITNGDKDISYFTVNPTPLYIAAETPSQTIECMEGQIVKCESINDNNIITVNQIDENNRFYLPETQLAENGIFIYNVFYNTEAAKGNLGLEDGTPWTKVDNLNVYRRGERVFKFGYDSYESRPYVEFPDDYSDLFSDGLFIYYARTNGIHGNISAHTLTQLEAPSLPGWEKVPVESFSVDNIFAATSGSHIETIKQAYNNFKKTIGTFETLVTCRDYMNKIYSMTNSVGKPYVSNILVTDMRNDLNRALTICSCDDAGIFYKERPIVEFHETEHTTTQGIEVDNLATKPIFAAENNWDGASWRLGTPDGPKLLNKTWIVGTLDNSTGVDFDYTRTGTVYSIEDKDYWLVDQLVDVGTENERYVTFLTNLACRIVEEDKVTRIEKEWTSTPLINHFDLVFYPFKSYNQIKSEVKDVRAAYDNSFNYTNVGLNDIKARLKADQLNTISHNIIPPRHGTNNYVGDIVSINNYLRLNATIATNTKITVDEGDLLKNKIKAALANAFNMRELDFGEEIPFESIIEVIENADARIKVASLNEPALYTTYSVFDHEESGHPVIVEYAVASEYLDITDAEKSGRFSYKDSNGTLKNSFDVTEARKIYNKLVLRNILAGRVSLFNYNNTFKTNFNEAPYQETFVYPEDPNDAGILDLARPAGFPSDLADPTPESPYNILVENGITYTARMYDDKGGNKYEFTKSKTPEIFENNVITKDTIGNNITKITPYCKINVNNGSIPGEGKEDFVLADGETIKFRAPNFTTVKTYPAYVNYHLSLNDELENGGEAIAAEAESLFSVLDEDRSTWSNTNISIKWQKVLDYFRAVDFNNSRTKTPTEFVQSFTLKQDVSKFSQAASSGEDACPVSEDGKHAINPATNTCRYCGTPMFSQVQKGAIVVDIKNNEAEEKDIEGLFAKSGCVKLTNRCIKYDTGNQKYLFRAKLFWDPADGETAPPGEGPDLDIDIMLASPFITDISTLSAIKENIDQAIEERRNMVREDGITPVLPSECSWIITFDFECVPFDPASLNEWNKFIKLCAQSERDTYGSVLNFKPIEELGTVFWRTFGEGYQIGKYIQANSQKLLKFDKNYFGLLPQTAYMTGIYLAKSLGQDATPHTIYNLEEYRLQPGEFLFIEYTPSSTTEDGTTQELPPVTEILGEGTIIRPNGFEVGLLDSDVYASQGNSAHKTVTFLMPNGSVQDITMHRFGANEQVEIRDLACVELSKDTFKNSPVIWVYKNFNDCPELETVEGADSDSFRSYTLKDGEFIFYTDQNKAELAYFTSGTEVQLHGNIVLPKCEAIDLVEVLDASIEEIPWKHLPFENDKQSVIFQEFQYVTIGQKDTVKNITLVDTASQPVKDILDSNWVFCSDVSYIPAGEDKSKTLPKVSIPGRPGDGWEVCSLLDISVSPSEAQLLRYVPDVVETGIKLEGNSQGGGETGPVEVSPKTEGRPNTLSFKTNLACQALSNNSVYLNDVYNKNKVNGFQFKFFTEEPTAIVKTRLGQVVPNTTEAYHTWTGTPLGAKDYLDIWNQVGLDKIKINAEEATCDNALRLSISTIPGTYGIMCIYINYTSTDAKNHARTWIEVIPGTSHEDIQILNGQNVWEVTEGKADRLFLAEGINCVRISNTCRIFVKTSEVSQGILMFDDLKLVDCGSIIYKNSAKEERAVPTYGLNLKQLKYLPLATEGNRLDTAVKARMEKALCDDLFKVTDSMVLELDKKTLENSKYLTDNYSNIKEISSDLDNLNNLSAANYAMLIGKYLDLSQSITTEADFIERFSEKTIEDDLLKLISQYAPADTSEAQLIDELEKLKAQIITSIKNRTAEQSLASFEANFKAKKLSTDIAAVFDEAQALTVQKLDSSLLAQLTSLVSDLERVAATEEKVRVTEALNKLQIATKASNIVDVQILLNKISNSADINDISSLITDMTASHAAKEYATLAALAVSLKNIISSRNVLFYVEELNNAIANGNSQAITLAEDLQDILGTETKIIGYLDTLIEECTKASPTAANVKTAFDNTVKEVKALYTSKVSELIKGTEDKEYKDSLKAEVEAIFNNTGITSTTVSAIEALISTLSNNADTEAAAIAGKISTAISTHNTNINTFKGFTTSTSWSTIKANENFEAFSNTLGVLWLQAFQKVWLAKFTSVEESVKDFITKQVSATNLETECDKVNSKLEDYKEAFDTYDKNILGNDNLVTIVEAATVKHQTALKNQEVISTINSIKSVVGVNDIITSAISEFPSSNTKNIILVSLLQDFNKTTNTAQKKATILTNIKAELKKLKASDEQLLAILDNQLFSNIAKILSKYKDMKDEERDNTFEYCFANELKNQILACSSKTIFINRDLSTKFMIVKSALQKLVESSLADFVTVAGTLENSTLLSAKDINIIKSLVQHYETKVMINSIKTGLTADDSDKRVFIDNLLGTEAFTDSTLTTDFQKLKDLITGLRTDLGDLNINTLDTDASYLISTLVDRYLAAGSSMTVQELKDLLNEVANNTSNSKESIDVLTVEEQLLAELQAMDVYREFYYTAPIETHLAIEFIGNKESDKSMMNPAVNYDINNVNNSFVISKLDIDYLDEGITLARASRLN